MTYKPSKSSSPKLYFVIRVHRRLQQYMSLRAAVKVCATLVNTQTHRQTDVDRLYY